MSFRSDFAVPKKAFRVVDNDLQIVGKYGRIIELEPEYYDVWFVGPGLAPLSGRRIGSIRRKLGPQRTLTELTGEAYTQVRGRESLVQILPIIKAGKRRVVTEKDRAKGRALYEKYGRAR